VFILGSRERCGRFRTCRSRRVGISIGRTVVGKDPIQRPACLGENLGCLFHLFRCADSGYLTGGAHQLTDERPKIPGVDTDGLGHVVPWAAQVDSMILRVCSPLVGQRSRLSTGHLVDEDQTLVFELRQGRIDGARARLPGAVALLGDLLDQFVSVHRTFLEQEEDCSTHVPASPSPSPTPASTEISIRSETAGPETAGAEAGAHALSSSPERATGMPTAFAVPSLSAASLSRTVIVRRTVIVTLRDPHLERCSSHVSTCACATSEFVCESFECVVHVVLLRIDWQVDDISAIDLWQGPEATSTFLHLRNASWIALAR
jgi:hypothetical protein